MIIQISYKRMWQVAVAFLLIIASWVLIGHFAWIKINQNVSDNKVEFTVKFLVPMLKNKTLERLSIESQLPGHEVLYDTEWTSPNTLKISIYENEYPCGLEYKYTFKKAPSMIPLFRVSVKGKVLHKVKPELLSIVPKHNVPTNGPITLKFNTFINPKSFAASVDWDGGCDFKPVYKKLPEGGYIDYSEWRAVPHKPLQNNYEYTIKIRKGLSAQNGLKLSDNKEVVFTTAPPVKISNIYPEPGAASVWLGRNISIKINQELKSAQITVKGVKGVTDIKGNSVVFVPERAFRPGSRYQVEAVLISKYGEKITKKYSFHTVNLGNEKWLEVKVGKSYNVWLLSGDKEVRKVSAWAERELPKGTLYENKRGWEEHVQPWIRLNADVLIHSLPEGSTGAVEDNHEKLGLPQTHSCLYMSENDINWLLKNLPEGFMVIVH
ncbi:L,D-transpeptidase family protein [Desulfolucanica intricata]|uniref:L,D-transpeptidase family protein n=1 Tax=Desulfolucanica intricata TaxID=1285191 RepID=UPI000834CF3A|nr:Ig-like domain-containing protein [Desulfolucanica intricata]